MNRNTLSIYIYNSALKVQYIRDETKNLSFLILLNFRAELFCVAELAQWIHGIERERVERYLDDGVSACPRPLPVVRLPAEGVRDSGLHPAGPHGQT